MYINARRRLKYIEKSSVQPMCNYDIKHTNIVLLLLLLFFITPLGTRVRIGV